MSHHSFPKRSSLSVLSRLGLPLLLAALGILALNLALTAPRQTALAHTVTVDGDGADWPMAAPSQANLGHIGRDTAEQGEYIWSDSPSDEQIVFPDSSQEDLLEFRVTADRDYVYFTASMSDVITATGAGAPQIRVAIDTDRVAGSGTASLGSSAETSTTVTATWEYLLVTPFGSASSATSQTILYQGGLGSSTLTGTAAISDTGDVLEFCVPWGALGMSEPPTLPLRFTVAVFRAQADDTTLDVAAGSDALDAITNYGDPGDTSNTSAEVGDGVVDYYFDLFFESDGDVYPPLLVSEVLYNPSGTEPDAEFIEIYNASPVTIDLSSYKVGDEEDYTGGEGMRQFSSGSIAPGQVIVWAETAATFTTTYGFLPDYTQDNTGYLAVPQTGTYPPWSTGSINLTTDDEVILLDGSDTAIDVVEWNDSSPEWTGLANTDFAVSGGESMERAPADRDSNDIARDFRVQPSDGTPGQIVERMDLAIVKSVNPPTAAPGETITYTLLFSNAGVYTATGVVITDVVPVSLSVQSVISSGVAITDTSTTLPTYTWDVQDLAAGDGGTITITGILSAALPGGHIFTNTAAITSTSGVTMVVDPDASNDSSAAGILISYADLTVTKTADPEPAVAGMPLTYTITITNLGDSAATGVTLSDTLHTSTTLQTLDQRDDTAAEFNAGAHQNTHWVDPRPGYDDDEWLEIADTLLASGVYTSRVLDARNVVSWTQLEWRPRRPAWKPLPDNGAAEEYYVFGEADMSGNRLLLHLDESAGPTFGDTSGLSNDGTCPAIAGEACPTAGAAGRFNGALSFTGAASQTVAISDTHDPARYAIELWVYPTVVTDTSFILRTDTLTGTAENYSHLLGIVDGYFQHTVYDGVYRTITSTTPVTPDMWHHVVGTAESNGDMKLFVDGVQEAQLDGLGSLWTSGDWFRLGSTYGPTGTARYFSGRLDEVAVYSRTLSAGEVLDHYLRGALRLSFEVRSCDNPACAGESWSGFYSEQTNTGLDWPTVTFSPTITDSRYFQYRATLATDDADYSPELLWVRVHPDHRAVFASQGSCVAQPRAFTCDLGDLGGGGVVSLTAFVNVNPSMLGIITNSVTVSASNDITSANNSASVTSTVESEVYLSIHKYDDDDPDHDGYNEWNHGAADPVNPGSPMTYTLEVHNGGPSDAWNVWISDTLPITVTGVAAHGNWSPQCTFTTHTISCTVANLGDYTWHHLVVTGTAPLTTGWITNTAWVTASASTVYTTSHLSDTETTLITPLADLAIVKSGSPDPVDPGAVITFTVVVTNNGPSPATGVVVTDTIYPGGYVLSTTEWSCSPSSGSYLICLLNNSLSSGASASFQITATAPVSGIVLNRAEVGSPFYDPDEENNVAYAYVGVLPVADLHIRKADVRDPVEAGAPLTYTLTVSNGGYVDAGALGTSVVIEDHHPIRIPWGGRARPYPARVYLGGITGQVRGITVTLYSLQHTYPGDLEVLLVGPGEQSAVLMANVGGGADVSATLTINDGGQAMPVSGTLTSTVTYRPTSYGLTGDLPPSAPAGPYGGSLSTFYGSDPNGVWRLYIYDTFGSDGGYLLHGWGLQISALATDTVTLSDTLPSGLIGVSVDAPAGWVQTGGDPLTFEADVLPVGAVEVFTITATAPITGGVITNTAWITSTMADFWPASNEDTITTTITAVADLAITKTVEPPEVVGPGMPLTYTLTISNGGPSPVQTVTVTDALPAGLTDVGAPGYCNLSALPALTCTLSGGLAVGVTADVLITANAPITPGVITNTAGVTATVTDPDLLNNTAFVTVTVAEQSDLEIVKTIQPDMVVSGALVTYTLHITNIGPSAAQAVTVTDAIVGVAGVGSPIGWSCSQAGGVFTCTTISLTVGAAPSIVFTATAPASGGVITNSVVITGAAPLDPDLLNNTYVLTTPVRLPPTITVPFEDYVTAEDAATVITFTVGDPDTPFASLNLAAEVEDTTLIQSVTFGGADANRTVTVTPAADLYGASRITLTVTDDVGLSDSDTFTLTVTPVNDAPWFTSTPVEDATVGEVYTYSITTDDVDVGDVLTISAPTLPASWLTLHDNGDRTALLSGAPAEADLGDHLVELLVRDSGGLTGTQTFTITVERGTYYIYLPLVTRNYAVAPDLVVDSIVAARDGVTVTIINQGPGTVEGLAENEFWVDVYFDPSAAPAYNQTWPFLCDHGLVWGVAASALPLDPGETLVLTVGDAYYRTDKSDVSWPLAAGTEVWAQVDAANEDTDYGAVLENHEIVGTPYNNVTQMPGSVAAAKFDRLPRKP